MTQTIAQADSLAGWRWLIGWHGWTPERCSDQLAVLDSWDGPWREKVNNRKVDLDRTAALATTDLPITAGAGEASWWGTSYGQPVVLADQKRKVPVANLATTNKPGDIPVVTTLPLPTPLRLEGDPSGSSDRHMRVVDPVAGVCWEAITVYPQPDGRVNVGYAGGGTGLIGWDMREKWNPKTSPQGGVIAANVPHTPLLGRADEIPGGIKHCLPLVLPNYSDEPAVGWARHTDGLSKASPLRAGDIVRLSCVEYIRACERFAAGTRERVLLDAIYTYGMIVVDKYGVGDPAKGDAKITLTQDPRWAGLKPLGIRLSMCEVIAPAVY